MANLYEFSKYKSYLRSLLSSRPHKGRGERTKLAAAARCNTAYVSQVLNGSGQFSLEQAERISRFLNHSMDEKRYFLLLVELERAGSSELRSYFLEQIQQIHNERQVLKNRLAFKNTLSLEDQTSYYSAWYYTAVHLLITMEEFQTVHRLAQHLNLPISRIQEILDLLVRCGLAIQEGERFRAGTVSIHLGADSPMLSKHHVNWRMQAVNDLDRGNRTNSLHYSSVVTVAEGDIPKVREILLSAIEQVRSIIRESKEDRLYCYTLDLFEVGGR